MDDAGNIIKHLYIECTHTASSGLNTGIQRVVRHVIYQLGPALSTGVPITLVTINDGGFYSLDALPDLRQKKEKEPAIKSNNTDAPLLAIGWKIKILNNLRRLREAVIERISWRPLRVFLSVPRSTFGLTRIIYMVSLVGPYRAVREMLKKPVLADKVEAPSQVTFEQGDVVLMLDSSWHLPAWEAISQAKDNGASIIAVIYDLIPITHPQFCEQALCDVFNTWFESGKNKVDGYIAISKTVQESLQNYLASMGLQIGEQHLGYFYLGADVAKPDQTARAELKNTVSKQDTYLIVSTIEPRKNHQYLLNVFNELWAQGSSAKLHIVGRVGWKVDEFLRKVKAHPQFNKKLFLWHDLNDSELVYCYKNSKSLVFPSYVEGFGLPIIEAQHYNLPVLASDTPIHQEVGGESVIYFDLNNVSDLVQKISDIQIGKRSLRLGSKLDLEQFTWENSARMLSQEIYRIKASL